MPRSPPPRNELYNASGHSVAADVAPPLDLGVRAAPKPPRPPSFAVAPAADPTIFPVHAPKWKANGLKPNRQATTRYLPSTLEMEQKLEISLRAAEARLEETVRGFG